MNQPSKIFAIGDIHGHYEKLTELFNFAKIDYKSDFIIFLGDYIDRGPDSYRVVDFLSRISLTNNNIICLKGNHEDLMEGALNGNPNAAYVWIMNGGDTTMNSYETAGFNIAKNNIPPEHLSFYKNLKMYYETDEYIFVHAGIWDGGESCKPPPLDKQSARHLIWIRDEFIKSECNWGKKVIFGHTPTKDSKPLILDNKIGIDTGAAYGGRLTCIELPAMEFYSV